MSINHGITDKIVNYIFELIDIQNVNTTITNVNTDVVSVVKYQTLSEFKRSIYNGNVIREQGQREDKGRRTRHEIQLTPYLTKGYITVIVDDTKLWLFYYCNVTTGLFRMWNLKSYNIGTWLNSNNKQLYTNRWLKDVICLVLFHDDKYYLFQYTPDRYFSKTVGIFPGVGDERVVSQQHKCGVYHIHYTKLIGYQLPTNKDKFAKVHILVASYYLHICKKIFFFRYGVYYLMKTMFDDMEYRTITFSECSIHNDKQHGLFRQWTSFSDQDKINWLNSTHTPINGFSDKLSKIVTYVNGGEHGLSLEYYHHKPYLVQRVANYRYGNRHGSITEYNKNGTVDCYTMWSNDERHGWDIDYPQCESCNDDDDDCDNDNYNDNSDIDVGNDDDENTDINNDVDDVNGDYDNNVNGDYDNDNDDGYDSDDSDVSNASDSRDDNDGVTKRLYYFDKQVTKSRPLMYLGLYLLCRDGYMVCHDDKINRFLRYFDKLPPEIMESILKIMCCCNNVRINKFFTSAGIDIVLYPIQ